VEERYVPVAEEKPDGSEAIALPLPVEEGGNGRRPCDFGSPRHGARSSTMAGWTEGYGRLLRRWAATAMDGLLLLLIYEHPPGGW